MLFVMYCNVYNTKNTVQPEITNHYNAHVDLKTKHQYNAVFTVFNSSTLPLKMQVANFQSGKRQWK